MTDGLLAGSGMQEVSEGGSLDFPCAGCGSNLTYAPESGALACEHCGHQETIPTSADEVVEHPFEGYESTGEQGYGTETKTFSCQSCGAQTTVEPQVSATRCPFCDSSQVDSSAGGEGRRPESLLPFAVEEAQVTQSFSSWISGLWFRPNALKQLAQLGKVQGVYIPHWTFDSLTESFWSAESGTHYYETESYTDSEGNQQTRRVRKTRWRHVTGRYSSFFDDCLVHASKGVDAGLMRKIYPYETAALVSYDPRFLAGWAAEDYQREMSDCWPDAKNYMDGEIRSGCIRQIPGDTHRGLRIKSSYLNRTYKLCLLPVWIAVYRYSGEVYPCLVNGQTGEIHGKAPLSVVKIIMAVLFVLALIAGVYFGFGRP